ncbi:hypothetical protein EJ08DRAFT_650636 [Tothia fuscella]|uniref:Uncharacterized protein n=1 Tax=Tothia fuscella TaxID=1048955 RepID=A0A9P4TWG4_9PEZI|nr:hypothetical protein EJ08DRAFT_650636 [Tothia fuscella]
MGSEGMWNCELDRTTSTPLFHSVMCLKLLLLLFISRERNNARRPYATPNPKRRP